MIEQILICQYNPSLIWCRAHIHERSYPRLRLKVETFVLSFYPKTATGPVFMKDLRLSQVLGLNPVLKLRLLSQLSFVLKLYSQRVT